MSPSWAAIAASAASSRAAVAGRLGLRQQRVDERRPDLQLMPAPAVVGDGPGDPDRLAVRLQPPRIASAVASSSRTLSAVACSRS